MNYYWFRDSSSCPISGLVEETEAPWEMIAALPGKMAAVLDGIEKPVCHSTAKVMRGALVKGPVIIGRGARIGHGAVVEGPAVISDGARVAPLAYVRASVVGRASVGARGVVDGSLLMDGASTGEGSVVRCSALGKGSRVGDGAVTACSDGGRTIEVEGPDGAGGPLVLDSGMPRLGLVLGDGAELGDGAVSAPGTTAGPGSRVAPGTRASGFVPEGMEAREDVRLVLVDAGPGRNGTMA